MKSRRTQFTVSGSKSKISRRKNLWTTAKTILMWGVLIITGLGFVFALILALKAFLMM